MASSSTTKEKKIDEADDKNDIKRPPISDMVEKSLISLHNRSGTSLSALKKHIKTEYNCDDAYIKRHNTKIKKYIIEALEKETLKQIKGKGLTGTFKFTQNPKLMKKESKKPDKEKKKVEKEDKKKKEDKPDKEGKKKPVKESKKKPKEVVAKPKKVVSKTKIAVSAKRTSIHDSTLTPKTVKKSKKTAAKKEKKAVPKEG